MKKKIEMTGENCTDETRREAYREALVAKIAEESAKAAHDKKVGEYRSVLKKAKAAGVNTEAIVYALKVRMDDPDETLIHEREKIKMLDLSGHLPGIKEKLFARLDIEEATTHEASVMKLARASDLGAQSGRKGISRDANPFRPGTEEHVQFVEGWLSGQRAVANEMGENAAAAIDPAPKRPRGRPKKTPQPEPSIAERFEPPAGSRASRPDADDYSDLDPPE